MPIQSWSENIGLVELQDDPVFGDDLNALIDQFESGGSVQDVVLDFSNVSRLNSSNIAQLLKLRKIVMINHNRKMKLCGINSHVWGVLLVTGLDKVFDYADNVATGLASIQIDS